MKFLLFAIGLFALASTLRASDQCTSSPKALSTAKHSGKSLADLSLRLYTTINELHANKNLIFSPASIALGLALLERGAADQTRSELVRYLKEAASNADVTSVYQALQHHLKIDEEKQKVSIANGMYLLPRFTVKDDYKAAIQQCFEGKIDQCDFAGDLENSRKKINQFVSDNTNAKIPELFKPGVLTADVVAVLVNAVYLKAQWRDTFNKNSIQQLPFYTFGRTAKTVPFLTDFSRGLKMVTKPTYDIIELAYTGNETLSMFIILPKERDGVDNVARSLTVNDITGIETNLAFKSVRFQMPKFYTRLNLDLKTVLTRVGIEKIFSGSADFSRMTTVDVKVGKAVHEAFIKVNENGTEAAAATGFSMVPKSGMPTRETVNIDHPFLYYIMHKPTGTPLFMGKVLDIEEEPQ